MPRFEPFRGTRYASPGPELAAVVAPPYDVLSPADRAALARHPNNIVHVDVPVESDGPDRYRTAAATLDAWLAEGVLMAEAEPVFYLYRMAFAGEQGEPRHTVGVVGALEVVGTDGDVLPHEQTTPKDATDRLELTRATNANLSPVWGLSLADDLADLLHAPGASLASVVDPDGVTHTLELVDNPARVAGIRAAVAASPVVIADGHHRYHVARIYADEQRAAADDDADGPWDLTLAFVVPLQSELLEVRAIHRLLRCTEPGWDPLAHLDQFFEPKVYGLVDEALNDELVATASLCLIYAGGMGVVLTPRPDAFPGVRDLDSARLEHALVGAPVEVRFQHGVQHVLDAVRANEADWGVLLRPVTVDQIAATARDRTLMPPKSTFFTPKPRTGLVLRRLADG